LAQNHSKIRGFEVAPEAGLEPGGSTIKLL